MYTKKMDLNSGAQRKYYTGWNHLRLPIAKSYYNEDYANVTRYRSE